LAAKVADVAIMDIGSTVTRVSAFSGLGSSRPRFLGQGYSPTTADIVSGVDAAFSSLSASAGISREASGELRACSTAGGALRVVFCGTAYSSTVRLAHEVAGGSGVQSRLLLTGALTLGDIAAIKNAHPNVIVLTSGPATGEVMTVVHNAELLTRQGMSCTAICAAGKDAWEKMAPVLLAGGIDALRVDEGESPFERRDGLPQVDAVRIHGLLKGMFEKHCVDAPGLGPVQAFVSKGIVPSPSALKAIAGHLSPQTGDLVIVDIGGSLACVCSSLGSKPGTGQSGAGLVQCDVQGDLGIVANSREIVERAGITHVREVTGVDPLPLLGQAGKITETKAGTELCSLLSEESTRWALKRHAGRSGQGQGRSGPTAVATGRDLTRVKYVFGTGGGLVRVPGGENALENAVAARAAGELLPSRAAIRLDRHCILTACGVLSEDFPVEATKIALESLGVRPW